MIKRLCFLVISTMLLTSCSNKAVEYNNKLNDIHGELAPKIKELVNQSEPVDSTTMITTLVEAEKLEKLTQEKLAEVKILTVPSGGERLKKVFLDEYTFVLELIKNIKLINNNTAQKKDINQALGWIMESKTKIEDLGTELKDAQQAFAKDKGFKIK